VRDKLGLASAIYLVILLLAAIFAPLIAPDDPNHGNLSNAMAPPVWNGGTWSHPVGTDWQGYDVFSRLLYGARTSLFIGIFVVVVAGTFGVIIGLISGYKGGRADRWLMGWVDVQVSFPGLLLAMLLIALVGGTVWTGEHHPRSQRVDGLCPHDARHRALGPRATVRRSGRDRRRSAAPASSCATCCRTCSHRSPRWPCSSSPASSWPRRR
jgi:ABC-type dipeptide/oligopeptide/nickel transport system permease subunit